MPEGKKLSWDETTLQYNSYFAKKKTKTQLVAKHHAMKMNNPSTNFWTKEQCKELLMEMEKPETMDYKVMAKRLNFKGKEDKQFENKTAKLRLKKIALLSAAATLDSKKRDVA